MAIHSAAQAQLADGSPVRAAAAAQIVALSSQPRSHEPFAASQAPAQTRSGGASAPAPTTPFGGLGGGVSGSFSPPPPAVFVALLIAFFCVPCLRYGRVVLAPARWRPVLFVSLLERPG